MKSLRIAMSLAVVALCGCSTTTPAPQTPRPGWHVYTDSKYGYEIQYPDGMEVLATGTDPERDGQTIRIGFKEYAALAPALHIQVEPRTPEDQFPKLGTQVSGFTVSVDDIQVNGRPARQAQYHWTENGDLAFAEIYLEGVVFFFDAAAGVRDFQDTEWWAIVSTFRLHS
jgi:hypothetical protein